MARQTQDWSNSLIEAIDSLAGNRVAGAQQDKTVDAEIAKVVDISVGEYKVSYEGNTFSAFSTDVTATFREGERVYVLVPQGDFSAKKIILGRSAYGIDLDYDEIQELTNFYIDRGPNWLTSMYYGEISTMEICAVLEEATGTGVTNAPGKDSLIDPAHYLHYGFTRDYQSGAKDTDQVSEYLKVLCNAQKAQETNADGNTSEQWDNFYSVAWQDLIEKAHRQFCVTATADSHTEVGLSTKTYDELVAADRGLAAYNTLYDWVHVKGSFSTNFKSEHDIGEYGIVVRVLLKNPRFQFASGISTENAKDWLAIQQQLLTYQNLIDPVRRRTDANYRKMVEEAETAYIKARQDALQLPYLITDFVLGFDNFRGSLYYYHDNEQEAYFECPKESFAGLLGVYLWQDGHIITDREVNPFDSTSFTWIVGENNISVTDLSITWAQKIDLTSSQYYAFITTPRGIQVSRTIEHVYLEPHLLYQRRDLVAQDSTRVRWFMRDARVTSSYAADKNLMDNRGEQSVLSTVYSGEGWYPIDTYISQLPLASDGTANKDYYEIDPDSQVLTIHRAAVPFQREYKAVIAYLKRDENENILQEVDNISTDVETIYNADTIYDLETESQIKGTSTFLHVNGAKKDNNDIWTDKSFYYGEWYAEIAGRSYSRIVGSALRVTEIDVTSYLITDFPTFRVAVYDPDDVGPNNELQAEPIAFLSIQLLGAGESDIHLTWYGDDFFHYDGAGMLKSAEQDQWYSLTPSITFEPGTARNYEVRIYAPDGQELTGTQYSPEYSMMKNIWLEPGVNNAGTIHFQIENQYNIDNRLNTFHLEIITVTNSVNDYHDVIFRKDGDSGTIGNDWEAHILPTNYMPTSVEERFTEAITRPRPMIAYVDTETLVPGVSYSQKLCADGESATIETFTKRNPIVFDEASALYLRPFIKRKGVAFEQFDAQEGYFYKVYWDVRMPASIANDAMKYASFLRLMHCMPGESGAYSAYKSDGSANLYENGGLSGEKAKNILEGNPDGLTGFTMYPWTDYSGLDPTGTYSATEMNKRHAAIRVEFFDNSTGTKTYQATTKNMSDINAIKNVEGHGTGALLENMQYRLIVQAQIDIFKGQWDATTGYPMTDGIAERICSIHDFYPVDLLLFGNKASYEKFKSEQMAIKDPTGTTHTWPDTWQDRIDVSWPKEVTYDASGYNPIASNKPLTFRFGPNFLQPSANPEYRAWNLTPVIQTIEEREVEQEDGSKVTQQYYVPKNHLSFTEGFHGVLSTLPVDRQEPPGTMEDGKTDIDNDSEQETEPDNGHPTPFEGGMYIRGIRMHLNAYGNVDINGWDGEGIDMEEETGAIFAATVGAGYKDPLTNAFTGVVMGQDRSMPKAQIANNPGYSEEEYEHRKYLTGLFGYQDGFKSFGLLENGTAFFGRADRGGRIILDGSNATIYGGGTDDDVFAHNTPQLRDNMYNRMRLNLVDLGHSANEWFYDDTTKKSLYLQRTLTEEETGDANHLYNVNDKYYRVGSLVWRDPSTKRWIVHNGYAINSEKQGEQTVNTVGVQGSIQKCGGEDNFGQQGFGGNYFTASGSNDAPFSDVTLTLPPWYKYLWQRAFIKPDGAVPYWRQTNDDGSPISADDRPIFDSDLAYTWGSDYRQDMELSHESARTYDKMYDEYLRIVDFDSSVKLTGEGNIHEVYKNTHSQNKYLPRAYRLNYYDGAPMQGKDESGVNEAAWYIDPQNGGQLTLFGPSRASTTPAIEIGQHVHGLMPAMVQWDYYDEIFRDFWIPGDRNFLVTYDGTLWAMNAIIMGNVIGSNFIGGRIQGSEIGIGYQGSDSGKKEYYTLDARRGALQACDYKFLQPPLDRKTSSTAGIETLVGPDGKKGSLSSAIDHIMFYVDQGGVVTSKEMHIYGGSIDLGRFHIIGTQYGEEEAGHLVQAAESDFIGPVHMYGNLGIGPFIQNWKDKYEDGETWEHNRVQVSGYGNVFQSRGIVAMGIPIPKGETDDTLNIHSWVINDSTTMRGNDTLSKDVYHKSTHNITLGAPNTVEKLAGKAPEKISLTRSQGDASLETSAFFGIDSASTPLPKEDGDKGDTIRGHMWPMHFSYGVPDSVDKKNETLDIKAEMSAWMTTMNIFASKGFRLPYGQGSYGRVLGANYFRVGPWGTEGLVHWIRTQFIDQDDAAPITEDNALGWFGVVGRQDDATNTEGDLTRQAIGICSVGSSYKRPIILQSSQAVANRCRSFFQVEAFKWGKNLGEAMKTTTLGEEGGLGATFILGSWGWDQNDDVSKPLPAAEETKGERTKSGISLGSGGSFGVQVFQKADVTNQGWNYGANAETLSEETPHGGILVNPWGFNQNPAGISLWTDGELASGKSGIHLFVKGASGSKHGDVSGPTEGTALEDTEIFMKKNCINLYIPDTGDCGIRLTCGNNSGGGGAHDVNINGKKIAKSIVLASAAAAITHSEMVYMFAGPEGWSSAQPGQGADTMGLYIKPDEVFYGNKEGHFLGNSAGCKFVGTWASPDAQHFIYARYG